MFELARSKRRLMVTAVLLLAHIGGRSLAAQEPLRWKFSPGETLQVSFMQSANTETVGAGMPTTIGIVMTMEMTWRVSAVAEDGSATMTQSFDRLTMSMKTGDVAAVDFDSAAEPTSAEAKAIAATVGPLIGATFQLVMSQRGEIRDVKIAETVEKAVASGTPDGLQALFSPAGISRVLRQSVVVLPEQPVTAGDTWQTTHDVESPLGVLQQLSVYSYAGASEQGGRQLEQIKVDSTLLVKPDAAQAKTAIKSQSQSGQLWFDRQRGRLSSSQVVQKLTTVRPYRDTKIEVRSTSKLTTTIR